MHRLIFFVFVVLDEKLRGSRKLLLIWKTMLVDVNLEEKVLVNPKYIVNEITDSERGHFGVYVCGKSSVLIFLKKSRIC